MTLVISAFALVGCTALQRAPTPLPTVTLGGSSAPTHTTVNAPISAGGVTASGVVTPGESVTLASTVGQIVVEAPVAVGDPVQAGQMLLRLDDSAAQAQLAQAQAALAAIQAAYDLLVAGPTAEALRAAQAAVDQAQARLDALTAGPRVETVAQAQANLAVAQSRLRQLQQGPTEQELALARLDIDQAKNARWGAQANRDALCGVKANPEYLCDAAQAEVAIAETGVQQAEARLAQLQVGAGGEALVQAQQAVKVAEAQLALARQPSTPQDLIAAQAQVAQAQAALDGLQAAPRLPEITSTKAALASAEAQVRAAELAIERLILRAPIAGVVTQLHAHVGEFAQPGQALVALADLTHLQVETTDLSERDAPHVAVGQPVRVQIEPLAQEVNGHVASIAPLAEALGGDVVYRATITLDATSAGLRPGMSVEVQFIGE